MDAGRSCEPEVSAAMAKDMTRPPWGARGGRGPMFGRAGHSCNYSALVRLVSEARSPANTHYGCEPSAKWKEGQKKEKGRKRWVDEISKRASEFPLVTGKPRSGSRVIQSRRSRSTVPEDKLRRMVGSSAVAIVTKAGCRAGGRFESMALH